MIPPNNNNNNKQGYLFNPTVPTTTNNVIHSPYVNNNTGINNQPSLPQQQYNYPYNTNNYNNNTYPYNNISNFISTTSTVPTAITNFNNNNFINNNCVQEDNTPLPNVPVHLLQNYLSLKQLIENLSPFILQNTQQIQTVNTLQQQVNQQLNIVNNLSKQTNKEKKDVEKLQKPSITNFLRKTIDNKSHINKIEKEEKEYKQAIVKEKEAKNSLNILQNQLQQAKEIQLQLSQKVQLQEQKKKELQNLMDTIILNLNLQYSHKINILQQQLNQELNKKQQITLYLTQYKTALQNLQQAKTLLQNSYNYLSDAKSLATADVFLGGGAANLFVDSMKYDNLNSAQKESKKAKFYIDEAIKICPALSSQPLYVSKITQGDFLIDVFFDNFIYDLIIREKIRKSKENMKQCIEHLSSTIYWLENNACKQMERDWNLTNSQEMNLRSELESEKKRLVERAIQQQHVVVISNVCVNHSFGNNNGELPYNPNAVMYGNNYNK